MSYKGIRKFAEVLNIMQSAKIELIEMGSKPGAVDKDDILLGQLLTEANDAVKEKFMEITMKTDTIYQK